jgi:SAM-dependent methyltransferase
MRWFVKAAVQNALSVIPKGREINHVMQRKLTHSLPGDDDYFRLKARKAFWHLQALQRHLPGIEAPRFFEFGAGWDLIGPMIYYALGVDDQLVVDVALLVQLDLVAHAIRQYTSLRQELEATWQRPLRPLGEPLVRSLEELSQRFGITYLAPRDAAATGLPSDSVDFVSSTGTVQHIPQEHISPILEECRRLLRPRGVISCHIDMFDGFAQFDHTLSQYNFLRYTDRTWAMVNSPFYFHNRLRARDYVDRFEAAGFDVVERDVREPTEEDLATLRNLPVAPRFRNYTIEELGIPQMSLVAVKP